MLPKDKIEKMETLSADKGYDGKELIQKIKSYGIKPIIDIKNAWQSGEKTKQYKETDLVYDYEGSVFIVNEKAELEQLKYAGDSVKRFRKNTNKKKELVV